MLCWTPQVRNRRSYSTKHEGCEYAWRCADAEGRGLGRRGFPATSTLSSDCAVLGRATRPQLPPITAIAGSPDTRLALPRHAPHWQKPTGTCYVGLLRTNQAWWWSQLCRDMSMSTGTGENMSNKRRNRDSKPLNGPAPETYAVRWLTGKHRPRRHGARACVRRWANLTRSPGKTRSFVVVVT